VAASTRLPNRFAVNMLDQYPLRRRNGTGSTRWWFYNSKGGRGDEDHSRRGLVLALVASSCSSKLDASGIYLQVEDRAVAFVQLVQSDDGKLSGRVETATIGNDGTVIHKDATEQGSISGTSFCSRSAFGTGVCRPAARCPGTR